MFDSIDKVMIFIDGSNLFHSCKEFRRERQINLKINYEKLARVLSSGRKLKRVYYYGSINPFDESEMEKQTKFYHALEHINDFHIVKKPLRRRGHDTVEKGIDVALVTDMLTLGFNKAYDTAIIVSGDGDYIHAVDQLKALGMSVEVAIFENVLSPELKRAVDKCIILDNMYEDIRMD